jgi:hypothetical protein
MYKERGVLGFDTELCCFPPIEVQVRVLANCRVSNEEVMYFNVEVAIQGANLCSQKLVFLSDLRILRCCH